MKTISHFIIRVTRSKSGLVLGGTYFLISTSLFLYALFGRNTGGAAWFVMYYSYWPVSVLSVGIRGWLKSYLSDYWLHEFPSNRFPLIDLFDGISCIVLGTIWYVLLGYLLSEGMRHCYSFIASRVLRSRHRESPRS